MTETTRTCAHCGNEAVGLSPTDGTWTPVCDQHCAAAVLLHPASFLTGLSVILTERRYRSLLGVSTCPA